MIQVSRLWQECFNPEGLAQRAISNVKKAGMSRTLKQLLMGEAGFCVMEFLAFEFLRFEAFPEVVTLPNLGTLPGM